MLIRWKSAEEKEDDDDERAFLLLLDSFVDANQWMIFFCSFSLSLSLSLSDHSKLSWSMMMVGSALSFDLDASRLIYTSNTWRLFFSRLKDTFCFTPHSLHQWWTSATATTKSHRSRMVRSSACFSQYSSLPLRLSIRSIVACPGRRHSLNLFPLYWYISAWASLVKRKSTNEQWLSWDIHLSVYCLWHVRLVFSIRLSLFDCYWHDDNSIDFSLSLFLEIENWKLTATTARYPIRALKTYLLLLARSNIP